MIDLAALCTPHRFKDGVAWRLTPMGVGIDGAAPKGSGGPPTTVKRTWTAYKEPVARWAGHFEVPAELILATICTESSGKPTAERKEPGYVSDGATPGKVSLGLMQTLISTAREALGRDDIDRAWILDPANAIEAGTAYLARQKAKTGFDPPKVACAYNAGGVYHDAGAGNRWKMKQYPIGTAEHADRFVAWFNDCFLLFEQSGDAPDPSFHNLLRPGA